MSKIFISYRRDDAAAYAGRLHDSLAAAFGPEDVFMDVVGIEPGVDFRKQLDAALAECKVVLALIGKHWSGAIDNEGRRRLDSDKDFVRLEIAAALKRDIPVIPLLLDGALMPKAEQLPDELNDFAFRPAREIRHSSFPADVDALITLLRPLLADDWALCRGDDPERGIAACTRLINSGREGRRGLVEALRNRAEFHRRKRLFEEAIADCDAALKTEPSYASAYRVRAQAHKDKGEFAAAIEDANKAIGLRPDDAMGYDIRGTVYRDMDKLDQAVTDFSQAISLDPKYQWTYYNRGFTYSRKRQFEAAVADYGIAMSLDPTLTAAYTQRGLACEELGKLEQAIRDYRHALGVPQKYSTGKWAHDKARERLAALGMK